MIPAAMPATPLRWAFRAAMCAALCLLIESAAFAQRHLSWDALDVDAILDGQGALHVTETHAMLFSGDWNGGERTFNLRPRQQFAFEGIERIDTSTGERIALNESSGLGSVDDYAFTDARTLRWRSRLPSDLPFRQQRLRYAIRYQLAGILLQQDDRYVLDHDFAFADRVGSIARFSLNLVLDPQWRPLTPIEPRYTAGPLAPGRSFVLTIPLQLTGADAIAVYDDRRPPPVVMAVTAILAVCGAAVAWLLLRERALGRFAPVTADRVDADWVRQHVLVHPPEIVGAAWDQSVDKDEVGAVIARLVAEEKMTGHVREDGSLGLALQVKRSEFGGYERALVDALFFDDRTATSTDAVQKHYEKTGFDPANTIKDGLMARVRALMPRGENPSVWRWPSLTLFLAGIGLLAIEFFSREQPTGIVFPVVIVAALLAGIGLIPGQVFRERIDWGIKALLATLAIPVTGAIVVAGVLWFPVGSGAIELSPWMIYAIAVLTIWAVYVTVNGLKSRNHRDAIAFRKTLAAGRLFFQRELEKEHPALQDDWYPWISAFGLKNEVAQWHVRHATADDSSGWRSSSSTSPSSSTRGSSSSEPAWTGAAGGRSGGAGGGATWATAVGGMAAGVSAPSSGGSGGSSGGSSSGGSSGGGGGGGW